MKTAFAFIASGLAALTAALPQPVATPTNGTIIVSLEKNLALGKEVISVRSTTDKSLVVFACGNKLTVKGIKIEVNADESTQGTLKVDGKVYTLDEDAKTSGGIVCGGHWNRLASTVECEVPWAVSLDDVERASEGSELDCISDGLEPAMAESLYVDDGLINAREEVADTSPLPLTGLEERQVICQWGSRVVVPQKNNPRKWLHWIQATSNASCRDGSCTAFAGQTFSITHKAHLTIGNANWVSGGYAVSATWSNSQGISCDAKAWQTVCVWDWRRSIAYDARKYLHNSCTGLGEPTTPWYRITSPLKGNQHHAFVCYRGNDCKHQGAVDWTNKGKGTW